MTFSQFFPDVEALLALEPKELAGPLLEYLNSSGESDLNSYNFTLNHNVQNYPSNKQRAAQEAIMEAWMWLEREGMLAPKPGSTGEWRFLTRRGKALASGNKLEAYRLSNLLPKNQLHPKIAQTVWATFLRGDYDTAVFQSFKELEVAVRDAAKLGQSDLGMDLMRKAFKPASGPLTDPSLPAGEQEALQHLMAGAIGSYKNPHSHRKVAIDATEAVEMIVLASHLLRIVDKRAAV